MVARIFAPYSHTAHDPDAAARYNRRQHLVHQLAELAVHMLHLISTIVVLAIVAYFIHKYGYGPTAAPFWVALAIVDIFVCFYALSRALFRYRAGDPALAMFTLAGLWLAALVLALKDYLDSTCRYSNSSRFDKCSIRSAHIAFSLLALFTSLVAMVMEIARWRHRRRPTLIDDKASQTSVPVTATTMPFPAQTTSLPPQNTPFPAQSTTNSTQRMTLPTQNTPFPA